MAPPATNTPDSPITLKIHFEGVTRKCKLPLKDMVADVLEDKLRVFLEIPSTSNCLFERHSDSAGSYVVLDKSNVPVYKQLFRAAKAKSKLKLRVTLLDQPEKVEEEEEEEAEKEEQSEQEQKHNDTDDGTPATKPTAIEPVPVTVEDEPENPPRSVRWCADRIFNNTIQQQPTCPRLQMASAASSPHKTPLKIDESTPMACPISGATFAVCCNSCDKTIPGSHYHCSTCDGGDFDLCLECIEQGITCYGLDHWLIKRFTENGRIAYSKTETIAPKPKAPATPPRPAKIPFEDVEEEQKEVVKPKFDSNTRIVPILASSPKVNIRTCNSCVQDYLEHNFLHCEVCEDFDLCKECFAKDQHGHHPKHGFVPAIEGSCVPDHLSVKLSPGRNQLHNAICDGCDKFITGIRYKCLDCPDWDYCAECILNAKFVHANHRFVSVYEPLEEVYSRSIPSVHLGICCDGPLCSSDRRSPTYISGIRYKCAVCHDTDFCANCEASPNNVHNKTHPLIKFKTPVRHVTVTTNGEQENGKRMCTMGDRRNRNPVKSRATDTKSDVKVCQISKPATTEPASPITIPVPVSKVEEKPVAPVIKTKCQAEFVKDSVSDGTVFPANHVFEQTWVLKNTGVAAWPAGCSVKFVGGDYMGHVDSKHPAGISELVSASESTVCYVPLAPGMEFSFTVLLRTPSREGKVVSYWRLTDSEGDKFGDRLWCDVVVEDKKEEEKVVKTEQPATPVVEPSSKPVVAATESMIFPKLEKESPEASVLEERTPEVVPASPTTHAVLDEFEECCIDSWDGSDDGFMTDEEYDILDASDEESVKAQK